MLSDAYGRLPLTIASGMVRTSLTHPLAIGTVPVGERGGRVGITFCPGKCQPDAATGIWERDLAIDLDAIRDWRADALATLIEDHELRSLRVEGLGAAARERGLEWFHLPIRDGDVPGPAFERAWEGAWEGAGERLRAILRDGGSVVVHCKGGLGRAGTVAARLLVEMGWQPEAAIAAVRTARPDTIENDRQLAYVRALATRPVST